jgi:hypothetical protein
MDEEVNNQPEDPVEIQSVNPDNNNMEVHHAPELHHRKKHTKEYFLEFLMIFLAVTMGFFAERFREHISDAAHEKEYVRSIVRNLNTDSSTLQAAIALNQAKLMGIDTLLGLSGQDLNSQTNSRLFYRLYSQYIPSFIIFKSDDETISQLRNSGGYRLIQKNGAADSISSYDQFNASIYQENEMYNSGTVGLIHALDDVIDITVFGNPAYYSNGVFTDKKLPAFEDSKKLVSCFNKVYFMKAVIFNYINMLNIQSRNAKNLTHFLVNTYQLGND